MELLIDFCYTSSITIEESNVQTLLPAACLLQLAEIQDVCCEFLKRQLDPSNCLGIRAFADTHACRDLLRIADKFTQHNFQEVGFDLFCMDKILFSYWRFDHVPRKTIHVVLEKHFCQITLEY